MVKDTKTALLDSAEAAARRVGFDGFSYADLAQDVGIRKASIHHHFPSKATLSGALMARYARRMEAACADIDAARGTGGARLKALVQLYRAALGDGTQLCLCVAFSISRDHLSADTLREVTQFRGITLQWLQTVFALGGSDGSIHAVQDTQIEAASTLALLEGAQLAARTQHDLGRFDMAVSLLEKRISS